MFNILYFCGMQEKRITILDRAGSYHRKVQDIRRAWIERPPEWLSDDDLVALTGNKGITATIKALINRAYDTID